MVHAIWFVIAALVLARWQQLNFVLVGVCMFSAVLSTRRLYLVFTCIVSQASKCGPDRSDAVSRVVLQGAGIILIVSCNFL